MTKPPTDNISIGETAVIEWIELKDPDNAFEIDELLQPTLSFWKNMETVCEAECCGISAFNFHDKGVAVAVAASEDAAIVSKLIELRQKVDELRELTLVSMKLNQFFDKAVFLQLMDHLIGTARSAQQRPEA